MPGQCIRRIRSVERGHARRNILQAITTHPKGETNEPTRLFLATSLILSSQQASAILMQTQGDAAETDPAISTVVDDSSSSANTIREIANFDVAKITGASAGLDITQTTQSNLYYLPLGFVVDRNTFGRDGMLELTLKLSYAADNEAFKLPGQATTSGISDTVLGLNYYLRSPDTVIRTSFSIKFGTGEFDDQLGSESDDVVFSVFARKDLGGFALKGNAGYVVRGDGPTLLDYGDSIILKAGLEGVISKRLMAGFDITYTDTDESPRSNGTAGLVGITTTDLGLYVDYGLDASSGFYVRVSSPINESVEDSFGTTPAPDRDTTVSAGFSVRY